MKKNFRIALLLQAEHIDPFCNPVKGTIYMYHRRRERASSTPSTFRDRIALYYRVTCLPPQPLSYLFFYEWAHPKYERNNFKVNTWQSCGIKCYSATQNPAFFIIIIGILLFFFFFFCPGIVFFKKVISRADTLFPFRVIWIATAEKITFFFSLFQRNPKIYSASIYNLLWHLFYISIFISLVRSYKKRKAKINGLDSIKRVENVDFLSYIIHFQMELK